MVRACGRLAGYAANTTAVRACRRRAASSSTLRLAHVKHMMRHELCFPNCCVRAGVFMCLAHCAWNSTPRTMAYGPWPLLLGFESVPLALVCTRHLNDWLQHSRSRRALRHTRPRTRRIRHGLVLQVRKHRAPTLRARQQLGPAIGRPRRRRRGRRVIWCHEPCCCFCVGCGSWTGPLGG